jgi:hypothetical protein
MKAILIDSVNREVKEVEVTDYKSYYPLLNCRCFTVAAYLGNGNDAREEDYILVDDEGLLTEPEHFFAYDGAHHPFAGNGLILGSDLEGESIEPQVTVEEVKNKITFLNRRDAFLMARLMGV